MSNGTLEPENLPIDTSPKMPPGHDARSIGHSDSSDSGSDLIGDGKLEDDDSDREGTGERLGAESGPDVQADADIGFDRIVTAAEAGLGGGLDQAEEAQLGITDEEIQELEDRD